MSWYPLTSGDNPVPGDPVVVAQAGRDYAEVAARIRAAAQRLRGIGAPSVTMSQATDAVKVQAVKVAGDVERAHERYASAGSALGQYADRLSDAQSRASDALTEARSAAGALDDLAVERRYRHAKLDEARRAASADAAAPGAAADVAAWQRLLRATDAEITVAETRLQRARDRVPGIQSEARRAADTARERIADAVENDGLNPTFWEKVGQVALQVTKVLAQVSEWVAGIAGTLSLVLAFIPFLQPLAAVRAAGTAVLEARSVAPEAGVTVRSLLRSPTLTKLPNTRAASMQASRWVTQEAPLLPRVAAQIRPSTTAQLLAERVGRRTALYDQLLRDLPPALASTSGRAQAAIGLSRLASSGVVGGVGYESLDTLFGVRASLEGAAGAGYTLPSVGLSDLSWVDDSFDPIRSQAVLHLPSGS